MPKKRATDNPPPSVPKHGGAWTLAAAAWKLEVSESTLRTWVALGQIKRVPYGPTKRIPDAEIQRILAEGTGRMRCPR